MDSNLFTFSITEARHLGQLEVEDIQQIEDIPEKEENPEMEDDQEMEGIPEIDSQQSPSASTEEEFIHKRPGRNQHVVRNSDDESEDEVVQPISTGQSQSNPIVIEDSDNEV